MNNSINYFCHNKPDPIPNIEQNLYIYKDADKYNAKVYNSFSEIRGGHINYYLNRRQIEDVFSAPVFTNKSFITASRYKDPMSSFKPEYKRHQVENNNEGQLTWIQDTCENREEMIALQMNRLNRTRYDPKWALY